MASLSVLRCTLNSDTPIVGVGLTPYVLLRRADASCTTDDASAENPVDGCLLRCRWFRSASRVRTSGVCTVHPGQPATLQSVAFKTFHCTPECFVAAWRDAARSRANGGRENGRDEHDAPAFKSQPSGPFPANGGAESWTEVARTRFYTPTPEDVGHLLRFECVPVDAATGAETAPPTPLQLGARVIAAPSAPLRRLVPLVPDAQRVGRFTVLTYNVLADLYANNDLYGSYCPAWALSWNYRRQNLLRELLSYGADILCLQEIQSDHFDDFFAPELARAGYAAVYKRKTEQVYTGSAYAIDGCATFFRKDAFTLIKKYEVEFNKAAGSLAESVGPPGAREKAMSRLMKNNVALILVLEALEGTAPPGSAGGAGGAAKRQLLCVANTHIHANPELNDVKLWQVHTLLKGLEKIAASAEIPMVVCGDFNSVPGSAAHSLLSAGRVDAAHPELATDPLGILRPASKLCHGLPLASAYASAARPPPGGDSQLPDPSAAERLRQRLDVPGTGEPRFTNCTRDFLGTLDYIFFTRDSLAPTALLELPDEASLRGPRGSGGLPSAVSSSDHVAIMTAFAWAPRR